MQLKHFYFALILVFFTNCNSTNKNTEQDIIPYSIAEHYFVKNDIEDKLLELTINTQEDFDKYFGMATVMGEGGRPTDIDFDKQYVIAIILPSSQNAASVSVTKLSEQENSLKIEYHVTKGEEQSFTSRTPLLLILDKEYSEKAIFEQKPI